MVSQICDIRWNRNVNKELILVGHELLHLQLNSLVSSRGRGVKRVTGGADIKTDRQIDGQRERERKTWMRDRRKMD